MATKMEGMLECRKCHTSQNKPVKYLGCLHIFCTDCLSDMITAESCVRCEMCNARTQLNPSGIHGLPDCKVVQFGQLIQMLNEQKNDTYCHSCKSNTRPPTLYCFDCQFFLCDVCHLKSHKLFQAGHVKVLSVAEMKGRNVDEILEKVGYPECSEHPGQIATHFDTKCNIPICNFHNNDDDDVETLGSVVKDRFGTIQEKMAKALHVAEVMKSRLNDLTNLKITISKDELETIDSTNKYFDKLVSCLENRRLEVLKEIQIKSEPTYRNVTNEMEKQEKTIEKYYDAHEFIRTNLENLPKNFLVADFDAIDWYLRHFNDNVGVKTGTLKGLHVLGVPQFQPDETLEKLISKTGRVEGGGQELATKRAPPKLLSKPKVPSRSGTPADIRAPTTPPRVKERKKRANMINLVDRNDKPVEPCEIVIDDNQYFILDRSTNKIHVADTNGHIFDTFTLHQYHGKSTWGLAVGGEKVLVSDIFYKHVVMLDKKGQVISVLHKTDRKDFGDPTGLAVNSIDKCVGIVDTISKQVHIFTLTPLYVKSLGGDWLRNPTAICVDTLGNFVVLDSSDALKFVVLNKTQNFVKHIYPPFEEIAIGAPQNISASREGRLCWSDNSTHSIVVVREDGGLCEILGGGKDGVHFKSPLGVCFDFRGRIVVCDPMNNCLVVL